MNIEQIQELLTRELPWKYIRVLEQRKPLGWQWIIVSIARDSYEIHNVKWQYREHISFVVEDDKITFQGFGWMGWRGIYRKIDPSIEREKYHALWRETMPIPRAKTLEKQLLSICEHYTRITQDIANRWLTY